MKRPATNLRIAVAILIAAISAPAAAERLQFDHRLSPELFAVLEAGDPAMVSYNDSNRSYLVDVIAVRGKSAQDWTEALVIIARARSRKVGTAQGWFDELSREARRKCSSQIAIIAQDARSITFERKSERCPSGYPPHGVYRVVQGNSSLFLLAAMAKDGLSDEARGHWLTLLESAHLE